MQSASVDIVADKLALFLGPHTAKSAVKTFAQKALNKTPEQLTAADMGPLLLALRPMLRTLIGGRKSEEVLAQLNRELGL